MVSIARKNLFHDKIRMVITVVGISFAVVLIFNNGGLYIGMVSKASGIIDNTDADIWVTSKNCKNFDFARPLSYDKYHKVLEINGLQSVEKLTMAFGSIKLKDGSTESIQIVGYNPDSGLGAPWRMHLGDIHDVKYGKSMIIDVTAKRKLKGLSYGDEAEVLGERFKVVGVAKDASPFIITPYVFMSHNRAKQFLFPRGDTTFLMVKVDPKLDVKTVAKRISRIDGIDVYTKEELSRKTRMYWSFETPMAIGLGVTALLALIVGMVIVGQTIYAATIERLREFGTLKAIGASNWQIYKIIFEQALINACLGYIVGLTVHILVKPAYIRAGVALASPSPLKIGMFFLTVAMCLLSSSIAIRKAANIDPVIVFKA